MPRTRITALAPATMRETAGRPAAGFAAVTPGAPPHYPGRPLRYRRGILPEFTAALAAQLAVLERLPGPGCLAVIEGTPHAHAVTGVFGGAAVPCPRTIRRLPAARQAALTIETAGADGRATAGGPPGWPAAAGWCRPPAGTRNRRPARHRAVRTRAAQLMAAAAGGSKAARNAARALRGKR